MPIRDVCRVTLDPTKRALGQIADRLAAAARLDSAGAASLAHILVFVPTAQSGRRLRLALAERFPRGLVPPHVWLPAQLVAPSETEPVAGRADELVAFWEADGGKAGLDAATQYADLRRLLGARALTFADVAARIGELLAEDEAADIEIARWRNLAEIEGRYTDALARRGKIDRMACTRAAVAQPKIPAETERIVIAAVLDPIPVFTDALAHVNVPVEEWTFAQPESVTSLVRAQIRSYGTAAREAEALSARLASVKSDEALPAICLADPEMFPDVEGAFEARGWRVHNPSSVALASSPLGHLAAQLAALVRTRSYSVFSTFLRGGDVRRWLMSALHLTVADYTEALAELDRRQAELLPETMDDIGPKTHGRMRLVYDYLVQRLKKADVRELLQAIFKDHILDEADAEAREFAAAAEALNGLLEACFEATVPEKVRMELFARQLDETTFSLEPDEGEVILTDGWLELPYLEADELLIAGFREGCVPESVVGHPFLPDALRRKLGLQDNAARGARDRLILFQALACRAPSAVSLSFHGVDAMGNVCKPSRLLFETDDDRELVARVRQYYGLHAGTGEGRAPDLPSAWRLRLPVPPPRREVTRLSPSALDAYLKCPFNYYLSRKEILGDKRMDDRAEELPVWEFGNFVHAALESWALSPLRDTEDAQALSAFLAEDVDRQLAARFGAAIPSIVALQGESIKRRLHHFASVQVAWHAAGWQVMAAERKLEVAYGHTRFHGKCDRIDYNARLDRWCVIDYKTWDTCANVETYDAKKGSWKSLQLPLYCAMFDALREEPFTQATREKICACYCVLGKTADEVRFSEPLSGDLLPEAEAQVRRLIARIEAGIFWPPSAKGEWRNDYKDWLSPSPAETVQRAWIEDQERRLAAWKDPEETAT